jgi:uncharacterized protein related to proFAR isomerase
MVSVLNGKVVLVENDKYKKVTNKDGRTIDIDDLASDLSKKFEKFMIADINGIVKNKPQMKLLKSLAEDNMIWLDAGIRDTEGVIDALLTGADKVIMSTKTIHDFEDLKVAYEFSENILPSIEYNGTIVSSCKGIGGADAQTAVNKIKQFGYQRIMFIDHQKEKMSKPYRDVLKWIAQHTTLYMGGARTTYIDENELEDIGIAGIIIEFSTLPETNHI